MMLNEICAELNNYFVKDMYHGKFKIENGVLICDKLVEGQYFRIIGSLFNDGIYQYSLPNTLLIDEIFEGTVWSMAVPKEILDLNMDIEAWMEKYKEVAESPYQSESFAGYSYTKKQAVAGTPDKQTWQGAFKSRLNRWRKI